MNKNLIKVIGSAIIVGVYIFMAFGSSDSGSSSTSQASSSSESNRYETRDNHEGKRKCSWCGGIGNVGYAGESEAQCRRTGMGKGNVCMSCGGTGYQ